MCPVGALTGFDSLNAIEATLGLVERFNIEVPDNVCLLVVEEEPPRALTVDEITTLVCRYLSNA